MSRRTTIRFSIEEKNKIASLTTQPQRLRDFLDALIKAKSNPSIDDFSPIRGYPGTEIQITGKNFADTREGNEVTVGGKPATVIEAKPDSLTILTSPLTKTGNVEVVANSKKAVGPVKFEALGRPKPDQDGPPIFYEGGGTGIAQGAPSTGTLRVLIVLCQANNLAPPNATTTRNNIVNTFNSVNTFYDQASYDQLNVQVDVTTNWRTLDGTINDFMDGDNLDYTMLDQIIAEAAQQAVDEGFNLNDYTLIAALVYTNQDIRCWGGGSTSNFQYNNATSGININISTSHALSTIWINETADWGRCAHEVGHCIIDVPGNLQAWTGASVLKEDVYRSDLVDPDAATAASFDMMGSHDNHPIFSGYYMEQMKYYNAANIRELTWDRNPFSQTYEIVAHGSVQNSAGSRYHLLKIRVSQGLYYYIEVRQRPDPASPTQVFDENIPIGASTHQGGVVVTKVLTDIVNMNQQMRFITLLHDPRVLIQNETATDPARFLKITVEDDHVVERPLTCRVKVEWAQVIGDTPGGDFDLRVEPWNSNYETPDVWIDRPPYGTYDYTDSSGNPVGNGDRPRPHDENKFYGRVHCDGQVDAANVRLTFYSVTPPGVGDNGNWAPLQTKTIPTIQKNTAQETAVIWVPEVGEHTCLKIYAEPQAGEINAGGNNYAQENVFNFEAPASSVPAPLRIQVAVRNPRKERTVALMSIRNVPAGYVAHFPHSWLWLEPLQERKQTLTVIPTKDYNYYLAMAKEKLPKARIAVDGFIPRQYEEEWPKKTHPASCFSPMGGILAEVTPKRRVTLSLQQDKEHRNEETPYLVALIGKIDPAMNAETVVVELEDPDGRRRVASAVTNVTGVFGVRFNLLLKPSLESKSSREKEEPLKGTYRAQAYIANSPNAAQATSNNVYIII